jgi:predicted nucleotidyltransferase
METLPAAIERIIAELKPEKMVLFGSYGDSTPESYVDLLVIVRAKVKAVDGYVEASNLLYPPTLPVNILVKTARELKEASREKGNLYLQEILAKGKVIYRRSAR